MRRRCAIRLAALVSGAVVTMGIAACQERVVRTQGIGSDELHPQRHEPAPDDRLSNWIYGDQKRN
ncbi:MAG: hypothetical protein ACF8PN_15715 [Phycisphaerales bacterium]